MALSRVTFLMDDAMRAEFEANMKVGGFRTQQEAFESMFKCKKREATAEEDSLGDEGFEDEAPKRKRAKKVKAEAVEGDEFGEGEADEFS